MGPVESFAAALNQHLQYVQQTAAASPAGGGPAWDGVLRHYGAAGFDAQERATTVQYMRLSRGALPGEVRVVLEALRSWAFREIDRLRQDPALDASEAMRQVRYQVANMVDNETTNYERMIGVAPPPAALPTAAAPGPAAPSLGSIFANAQQTSKEVPWANMKYKQVVNLTCGHCGGAQEQPTDFMCKYCRRPIAGTIKPTT
jgi:hypothetical protein